MKIIKYLVVLIPLFIVGACNSGGNNTPLKPILNFSISTQLQTESNPLSLPRIQGYAETRFESYLVIVGGNAGGIHDFSNGSTNYNQIIYWLNLANKQVVATFDTNQLSNVPIKTQLATVAPEFVQSGNFLYYIGGIYVASSSESGAYLVTESSVIQIDLANLTNAVLTKQLANVDQYFNIYNESRFQVTGGNAININGAYYLAFGHNFTGVYQRGKPESEGIYNPYVIKFKVDSTKTPFITEISQESSPNPNVANRRRDTNLWPASKSANDQNQFVIGGGPFQPRTLNVFTSSIVVDTATFGVSSNNSILPGSNQPFNQYNSAGFSMYSASKNLNYLFTLGGASVNFINPVSPYDLAYNSLAPFSDVISVMVGNNTSYTQYYQNIPYLPSGNIIIESTPLFLLQMYTAGTRFYPLTDGSIPLYANGQINLDQLLATNQGQQQIFIGYLYGGIITTVIHPLIFNGVSKASNNLYKVYMNLNQNQWKTLN